MTRNWNPVRVADLQTKAGLDDDAFVRRLNQLGPAGMSAEEPQAIKAGRMQPDDSARERLLRLEAVMALKDIPPIYVALKRETILSTDEVIRITNLLGRVTAGIESTLFLESLVGPAAHYERTRVRASLRVVPVSQRPLWRYEMIDRSVIHYSMRNTGKVPSID